MGVDPEAGQGQPEGELTWPVKAGWSPCWAHAQGYGPKEAVAQVSPDLLSLISLFCLSSGLFFPGFLFPPVFREGTVSLAVASHQGAASQEPPKKSRWRKGAAEAVV